MTVDQIGEMGDFVNDSVATSAMNDAPDADRIRKYDTIKPPTNFMTGIIWCVSALIIFGTVYLFMRGHWIIGLVGVPFSVFAALVSYYALDSTSVKEMAYKDGLLTPAIVVNVDPIELIAMANMRSSIDGDEIYGCQRLQVESLPLHSLQLGEKVPCASLFTGTQKGRHKVFNARPVCWGFDDASKIERAIESISADDDCEFFDSTWAMLSCVESKMSKQPFGKILFFDARMQLIG